MFRYNHSLLKVLFRNHCPVGLRRSHNWLPGNVVKSPYPDVSIPECTLAEYVWRDLEKWSMKTALICGITDRRYTYEQLYRSTRRFGANLRRRLGVRDGDTISVMLPNMPEYPIVVFGALTAGAIVSTINPIYSAHEVHRQLEISETSIVVASPETVPVVQEALKLLKKDMKIIVVSPNGELPESTISFSEFANDESVDLSVLKEVRRGPDDVCLLPYSSGTTGLPKGVQLTNRNIVANCQQQATEMRHYDYTTSTNQDTVLAVLPYFHSYGLSMVMTQKLSAGLREIVLPNFKPNTFLNALVKYKVNLLFAAPPMVLFLGSHPDVTEKPFEHIKSILCGAAPLPNADIHKMMQKAGRHLDFVQGYGLTESGPLATVAPRGFSRYASVGYALPNVQLRVVDSQLNNLGPKQIGELLIKGPNIMKGYKDNPEANREIFLEGGWLRSGDQGLIDEDGSVTIADRLKELIKVKGYQVPPAELEALLKEHPAVLDAAVIGVPDAATGEKPLAFVVAHKGKTTDKQTILDFVSQRVATYKRIKDLHFIESVPKNPSGKILRRVLREEYAK